MPPDRAMTAFFSHSRRKGKRRYISPGMGVQGFFEALNAGKTSYVVLRWFETLPELAPGEDIDLLIADDHLDQVAQHLTGSRVKGIPCDLYTASGLPGSEYRGVSYFPPELAKRVLETAVMGVNGVRAPDGRHHLLTMCYHALIHKGYASGLPVRAGEPPRELNPEHDYVAAIAASAARVDVVLEDISLDGLRLWLMQQGWLPPVDTLEKLAQKNLWIRDAFFTDTVTTDERLEGLVTFIVRERGVAQLPLIREILWREGFDLLHEAPLPAGRMASAALQMRGGNWHRGPWPQSGGGPAHVLVAWDMFPIAPSEAVRTKHFSLTNERILKAKLRVRDAVNSTVPHDQRCNVMHSSDNPRQALHYLDLTLGYAEFPADLAAKVTDISKRQETGLETVQELSRHGRRAAVRLVRHRGELAVCKLFRPGRERFMEREQHARRVAGDLPYVLPILEAGDGYLLFPYLSDLEPRHRFFRPGEMVAIRSLIRHFRSAGYELIDFKPGNVLVDRRHGLKVIDFEFMQAGTPTGELVGCYCWYRVPSSPSIDVPAATASSRLNYHRYWMRHTGLPLFMAVRELPPILVMAVQAVYRAGFWGRDAARAARQLIRTAAWWMAFKRWVVNHGWVK